MVHQDPKFRLSYRLRGLASPRRYRRQKSLQGVFCIIVMVANSYCSGASADIRRSGPTSSPNLLLSAAVPEACAAWREKVSRIHPSQRNVFSKHGVVLAGGGILLAAKFEQNCKLRLRLGEYFGRRVGGEATEYDQEFAKDHSKRVVAVLEKLWPVLSDPSTKVADGAFHFEKYMLLADPALNEEDIGPVAAQIVEKEGLYLDLAFVLLQRALPSVEAVLRTELQKARSAKSVVRFVCTLACLQTYGDEAAPDLADFLSSESWLDEPAEKVLRQLLAKLRQGGKIRYADLEEIEYRESRESRGGKSGTGYDF